MSNATKPTLIQICNAVSLVEAGALANTITARLANGSDLQPSFGLDAREWEAIRVAAAKLERWAQANRDFIVEADIEARRGSK